MKFYKKYQNFKEDVERYIKKNNICCRYAGWSGMAGNVDIVKVDGNYLYFNNKTGDIIKNIKKFY